MILDLLDVGVGEVLQESVVVQDLGPVVGADGPEVRVWVSSGTGGGYTIGVEVDVGRSDEGGRWVDTTLGRSMRSAAGGGHRHRHRA